MVITVGVAMSAACGGAPPGPSDLAFVHHMVPHHELGLRMTELALLNAQDVRVREFGFEMSRYQGRELVTLRSLKARWLQHAGSHTTDPPDGMLTAAEEDALATASGPGFDHLWLDLMIRHHEGAVAMAADELANGRAMTLRSIAAEISKVQTCQIEQMRSTKAALGSELG